MESVDSSQILRAFELLESHDQNSVWQGCQSLRQVLLSAHALNMGLKECQEIAVKQGLCVLLSLPLLEGAAKKPKKKPTLTCFGWLFVFVSPSNPPFFPLI